MQKITPFLWFDGKAQEAANFYVSAFKNSRIVSPMRAGGGEPSSVTFEIDGRQFIAFNGGPHFTFSPAISLFVRCETQSEIDELWEEALRRRRKATMRLAEGQIWRVLADRSSDFGRAAARQGC